MKATTKRQHHIKHLNTRITTIHPGSISIKSNATVFEDYTRFIFRLFIAKNQDYSIIFTNHFCQFTLQPNVVFERKDLGRAES